MKRLFVIVGLLIAGAPLGAMADSACWLPSELRAYDITMSTLRMAHDAADCDKLVTNATPLRNMVSDFVNRNQQQMSLDRDYLAAYYRRAYGDDWETPLNKSLGREDQRLATLIQKGLSPQYCEAIAARVNALQSASWDDFVQQAEAEGWHDRAQFPACP